MSAVPRWMVERWQRTVAEHRRRWCPICKRRLCWEQAEARGQLIAHGQPLTPPKDVQPQQAADGARSTA